MTHYIHYDNPKNGRRQQADCGDWRTTFKDHDPDPDCPDCRRLNHLPPKARTFAAAQEHAQMDQGLPLSEPVAPELEPVRREPADEPIAPPDEPVPPATGAHIDDIAEPLQQALESITPRAERFEATVHRSSDELAERMNAHQVVDAVSYVEADRLYAEGSLVEKAIEAELDPVCAAAYRPWKMLTDKRSAWLKPIVTAKQGLSARAGEWKREQARIAADAARALEAKAKAEQDARLKEELAKAKAAKDTVAVQELKQEIATAAPPAVHVPTGVPENTATKKAAAEKWVVGVEDWMRVLKDLGDHQYPEMDAALQEAVLSVVQPLAKTLKATVKEKYPGLFARDESGAFSAKGSK